MKTVGLRFLLTHGSFMDIMMTEDQARQVVKSWASGEFRLRDKQIMTGDIWAVKMDEVIGIHTYEIQRVPQQQAQGPLFARPNIGGSGL